MAFIHVRIANNSPVTKYNYRLDDGPMRFFEHGEYVEVSSGTHVLTFENWETRWTVQETIKDNQDLEVIVFVGSQGIIGAPEFYVNTLDDYEINMVRGFIKDAEEYKQRKDDEGWSKFGIGVGVVMMGMGIGQLLGIQGVVGAIMGTIFGVPGAVIFLRNLISLKRKKKQNKGKD